MPDAATWLAVIPTAILVLGFAAASLRWIGKVNRLMEDYREDKVQEAIRAVERKATEALVSSNAEHIAELTRNVERVVRAWDEFVTKRKEV